MSPHLRSNPVARRAHKLEVRQRSIGTDAARIQSGASPILSGHLPDEIWLDVFHYLNAEQKLAIKRVSKQFSRVAESPDLWRDYHYVTNRWTDCSGIKERRLELVRRQTNIINHADGQIQSVRVEVPEDPMTDVMSHVIEVILIQSPTITQMYLHGNYGRVLRKHFSYLTQLQSLHLIEQSFCHFLWYDYDDDLFLPPSLKRLCVESVSRLVNDRDWKISGPIEELTLRGNAGLDARNLAAFKETLTYLDLTGYRLNFSRRHGLNTPRLMDFTILQHLRLTSCIIAVRGQLPESLIHLHISNCSYDQTSSTSWMFSNLPGLKNVSLSYFKQDRPSDGPFDAERLLEILVSSALKTKSKAVNLDLQAREQLQQGFQLETLVVEDCGPPDILAAYSAVAGPRLREILQNNCANLTTLDLSLPLLTAHHLDDVANFCPSLKDLTIGKSDTILPVTLELFIQKMSGRLQRLRVHHMACYEKNTCFSSAQDACSSLIETCRSFGIELVLELEKVKEKVFLTPYQIASMNRMLGPTNNPVLSGFAPGPAGEEEVEGSDSD